jgi:hypothetical protein
MCGSGNESHRTPHFYYVILSYCGVAPCPLLDNGYASGNGFIGNHYKSTQQPTSEYWKHIRGSFPRQRESAEKFPAQQIGRFMTTNYPTTCLQVSPRRAYFTGSNISCQTVQIRHSSVGIRQLEVGIRLK